MRRAAQLENRFFKSAYFNKILLVAAFSFAPCKKIGRFTQKLFSKKLENSSLTKVIQNVIFNLINN